MTFSKFRNRDALKLGNIILELAIDRNQRIGVEIRNLHQQVFFYIDDGLSKDKNNWLSRKCNTTVHFMMTTKDLNEKLKGDHTLIQSKYGLPLSDYTLVPGGVPIFNDVHLMVGVVAVTGLTPDEDHQLVMDAFEIYKNEGEI